MQKDGGAAHRRPSSLNQRVQGSSPCRPTHKLGCFGDIQSTIPRRVVEDQAVQHFTPAELAALARFYATLAGRSIARKSSAFTAAVARAQTAEVAAWARTVGAPIEPQASGTQCTQVATSQKSIDYDAENHNRSDNCNDQESVPRSLL